MSRKYRALLINPWIYDVAAYDFWAKPIGLLYLASLLEKAGVTVDLVDCQDRFDPDLLQFQNGKIPKGKKNGTGKYIREKVTPPKCLIQLDRQYSRYGFPINFVRKKFNKIEKPDIVLITSAMTYWYPAVKDMVLLCREIFPGVQIILGGIYASLCPDNAEKHIDADLIFSGEGEKYLFDIIRKFLPDFPENNPDDQLDNYPFPAYHLYPSIRSLPILTSRGCPFRCSFCASNLLMPKFRRRSVDNVLEELRYNYFKNHVRHFVFYDDALLVDPQRHIMPILLNIVSQDWPVQFHTPNGLHPKYIEVDLANLLVQSGFETIRLSFETSSSHYEESINHKVNADDLANAIDALEKAGFPRKQVEVYVLTGLPKQNPELTLQDLLFVHGLGVKIRLAQFSPIPGTKDWWNAVDAGMDENIDLVCTNSSIFAQQWGENYYQKQREFHQFVKILNYTVDLDLTLSGPKSFLNIKSK